MPNPALNDGAFARETRGAQPPGSFEPGWGAPASELPPGVFDAAATTGPGVGVGGPVATDRKVMTMGGTASATAVLLLLLVVAGWFGWQAVTVTELAPLPNGDPNSAVDVPGWFFLAMIAGLGIAILTIVKPTLARFTAPLYAVAEGLLLGVISRVFEVDYSGIVLQAVMLTIGVFLVMLVLFATGAIKVTEKVRLAIIASTFAIAMVYLVSLVASFFGSGVPFIHDAGPIGIGFSLVVVGVASMNLLLDFDLVQRGVAARAPKYMEWYAAFGLMITLVWLYLEILRLLAKLRSR